MTIERIRRMRNSEASDGEWRRGWGGLAGMPRSAEGMGQEGGEAEGSSWGLCGYFSRVSILVLSVSWERYLSDDKR